MKAGDVVLIAVPQSDGQIKPRPAVLIKEVPPFSDWILCPVSSQLRHELAELYTARKVEIRGVIGTVSPPTFNEILQRLTRWLQS